MRHVSFALLLWCIWIAAALGQTRATSEGDSSALQGGAASGVAEKPIDLHVQTQKRQAEARMRAEERTRAARALPEVRMFCTNNVSTAGAARVAWEAAKLEDLDARLQQRIAELEAKRAEYEDWLHRRDEALKKARDQVVAIYSKMEPEAAANELAQMDDETAAAVLSKLNTRSASAILGEMDPTRAAHLTDEMVGANLGDGKKS